MGEDEEEEDQAEDPREEELLSFDQLTNKMSIVNTLSKTIQQRQEEFNVLLKTMQDHSWLEEIKQTRQKSNKASKKKQEEPRVKKRIKIQEKLKEEFNEQDLEEIEKWIKVNTHKVE